jgi:hypothetical protein
LSAEQMLSEASALSVTKFKELPNYRW